MKFNIVYDYQLDSLVKISRHLLTLLIDTLNDKKFKFSIKILIDGDIRNTQTGEVLQRQTPFPNHMFQVRTPTEQTRLIKSFSTYLLSFQSEEANPDLMPNTKWTYDKVNALSFKICKLDSGGCAGAKTIKSWTKAIKNPDNKDDLCFWRCFAIALYSEDNKDIRKKDSKKQRDKAQWLKKTTEVTLKIQLIDTVAVNQIPFIAQVLKLDIRVYHIDENGQSSNLWLDPSLEGNEGVHALDSNIGDPILLHFEEGAENNDVGEKGYSLLSNHEQICRHTVQH